MPRTSNPQRGTHELVGAFSTRQKLGAHLCSTDMAVQLSQADSTAAESGEGSVYGCLVALGASEYRPREEVLAANKGAYGDLDADLVDKWRPVGLHNIKYVLKRNAVPNGKYVSVKYLRSSSSSLSKVGKYIFNTTTDVTTDLFQLGRSSSAANAIVVKGPQWLGKKSQNVGPVSRYACRIVVDRLSPYRARVYAGGLDDRGDFCLSENAIHVDPMSNEESMVEEDSDYGSARPTKKAKQQQQRRQQAPQDYLQAYGVRIWRPDSRIWMEVGVFGNTYTPRPSPTLPGQPLRIAPTTGHRGGWPFTNELIEGSILDICGAYFVFQSAHSMALTPTSISPEETIRSWNGSHSRLHCPVLYSSLKFTYTGPELRARLAFEKSKRDAAQHEHQHQHQHGAGGGAVAIPDPRCSPCSSSALHLDVPLTDPTDVVNANANANARAGAGASAPAGGRGAEGRVMVFPACGHVHGYHQQLQNQPCPMCRQEGPYVPLAFSFEPSIWQRPCHDLREQTLRATNGRDRMSFTTRAPPSPSSLYCFNPCGHAVTLETAQHWAAIRFMPDFLSFHQAAATLLELPSAAPSSRSKLPSSSWHQQCLYGGTHAICPFCSTLLDPRRPYSQLVMQSESGSDCDDAMACDDEHDGCETAEADGVLSDDAEEGDDEGHRFLSRLRAAGHDLGTLAEHLPPSALALPTPQRPSASSPRSRRG